MGGVKHIGSWAGQQVAAASQLSHSRGARQPGARQPSQTNGRDTAPAAAHLVLEQLDVRCVPPTRQRPRDKARLGGQLKALRIVPRAGTLLIR